MNERVVLGRGLDALIGDGGGREASGAARVVLLPEESIGRNAYQPRHRFEETALDELARSITEKGVIQPIIVRKRGDGYEVIAGERRLLAARRAGLKEVPALIREVSDRRDLLEIAIIENIQREDLNPLERARSYRRLIDEFGETQEEIARRMGKDRSTIANTLRILELPGEVKNLIEDGRLNFGQARTLLALDSRERQLRLARRAADGGLSVRELEKLAAGEKTKSARRPSPPPDPQLAYALDVLREQLKAKVSITPNRKGGGRIEIEYYSGEELARICRMLGVDDDTGLPSEPDLAGENNPG